MENEDVSLMACIFLFEKRRADFIPDYPIDTIKRVHFTIIGFKRKIEYNIVKYPFVGAIKSDLLSCTATKMI